MDTRANLFVLFAGLVVSSMAPLTLGCSLGDDDDTSKQAPKDASTTPWWDVAQPPPSNGDDTGDVPDTSTNIDASAPVDASVPVDDDASAVDAGPSDAHSASDTSVSSGDGGGCPAGATQEVEPNEVEAKATTFTALACGTIAPASDVDVWTFTLPASAQHLGLHYDGPISLTVSSSGDTVTVPGAPSIPFHAGAVYTITVRGTNGHTGAYDVTLQY